MLFCSEKVLMILLIIVSLISGLITGTLINPNDYDKNLQQRYDALYEYYLETQARNIELTEELNNMTIELSLIQEQLIQINIQYEIIQAQMSRLQENYDQLLADYNAQASMVVEANTSYLNQKFSSVEDSLSFLKAIPYTVAKVDTYSYDAQIDDQGQVIGFTIRTTSHLAPELVKTVSGTDVTKWDDYGNPLEYTRLENNQSALIEFLGQLGDGPYEATFTITASGSGNHAMPFIGLFVNGEEVGTWQVQNGEPNTYTVTATIAKGDDIEIKQTTTPKHGASYIHNVDVMIGSQSFNYAMPGSFYGNRPI